MEMDRLPLNLVVGLGLALCSTAPSPAAESARSSPKDTHAYSRPAIPGDKAGPSSHVAKQQVVKAVSSQVDIVKVVDAVVNNTDPNLTNTDTFNDGEISIAVNPLNSKEITMTAFSGSWGVDAPVWHSTDGGHDMEEVVHGAVSARRGGDLRVPVRSDHRLRQ
jgi:hypothetical protein